MVYCLFAFSESGSAPLILYLVKKINMEALVWNDNHDTLSDYLAEISIKHPSNKLWGIFDHI